MSEENKKHLVVAAAGTGGHVFPALAVARELRNRGWKISWIGTQTGMESKLIAKDAIDFTGLDFNGVRGKGFFGMISGGIKLLKAMSRCKSLMRELKPDVMFTTGGYVAVPVTSGCRKNGVRVRPWCRVSMARLSAMLQAPWGQSSVLPWGLLAPGWLTAPLPSMAPACHGRVLQPCASNWPK